MGFIMSNNLIGLTLLLRILGRFVLSGGKFCIYNCGFGVYIVGVPGIKLLQKLDGSATRIYIKRSRTAPLIAPPTSEEFLCLSRSKYMFVDAVGVVEE